jgi:hypothetical protein
MIQAFEILVNGERLCIAGIPEDGVLTAIVCQTACETTLTVGGLVSAGGEQLTWADTDLKVKSCP